MEELLRQWGRSGLLEASQVATLQSDVHTDLRRTNAFLRALLFVFTAIIVIASVYLVLLTFHVEEKFEIGFVCILAAVVYFGLAEFLVGCFRLYRFGIEEALASTAAVLLAIGAALIAPVESDYVRAFIALATGAIGAGLLYARLGYLYAAGVAIICAASIPFTFAWSGDKAHLAAASVYLLALLSARRSRLASGDEYPGSDYGVMQAIAWMGIYLVLNVHAPLFYGYSEGAFYWFTYAMIWVIPIVGLWLAIPVKDRLFLQLNVGLLLVTFLTNKPYLKLMRKPWDPILFGVLLIGAAVVIKRWLACGANGQRDGYTAGRVLADDRRLLNVVATMSSAMQPAVPSPAQPQAKPDFGGGRSGGAGASGNF